jgi:hypothetical protein
MMVALAGFLIITSSTWSSEQPNALKFGKQYTAPMLKTVAELKTTGAPPQRVMLN